MAKQQKVGDAVQHYGKRLFGFIRSRVKSDEDAEDILQDVWFYLSSVIDLEPIGQLSAWLFRVSRNRIIDKQRISTRGQHLKYYRRRGRQNIQPIFALQALLHDLQMQHTEKPAPKTEAQCDR